MAKATIKAKGQAKVLNNYKKLVGNIAGIKTKATLAKVLSYGVSASKEIAPVEYGTLVNSAYRDIKKSELGWHGVAGYTTDYAAALHERTDWNPRPPEEKAGPSWNPIATPGFLRLGFEGQKSRPAIQRIIIEGMKLK